MHTKGRFRNLTLKILGQILKWIIQYPPFTTLPYPQLPPLSPYTYSHLVLEARDDASCRGGTVAQARTPRLLVISAACVQDARANGFDFRQPGRPKISGLAWLCVGLAWPAMRRTPDFGSSQGLARTLPSSPSKRSCHHRPWFH